MLDSNRTHQATLALTVTLEYMTKYMTQHDIHKVRLKIKV